MEAVGAVSGMGVVVEVVMVEAVVVEGPLTGLWSRSEVTASRSGVIVAETKMVCTESGSASPMAAMSCAREGGRQGEHAARRRTRRPRRGPEQERGPCLRGEASYSCVQRLTSP